MSNFISYAKLIKDRENFRKSGTRSGDNFNLYDTPGHKYFKLFFYFDNGDGDGEINTTSGNGFLTPTWLLNELNDKTYYLYNSAWSYLMMNAEDERADLLKKFVELLSNISAESPWYFSEISGLDAALERKQTMSDNFTIEATRPKISIKCLPDAYDDRIGTLLDLYRAITWSWMTKREVLPANLRKFDMGIFIFETPNEPFHVRHSPYISTSDTYSGIGGTQQHNRTSYKYIELHNCEIDYSSSKTMASSLNNKDGFNPEYNIEIFFDDCYEIRYNEFMMKEIGDVILFDLDANNKYEYRQGISNPEIVSKFVYPSDIISEVFAGTPENERLDGFPEPPEKRKGGFLSNAVEQLISTGKDFLTGVYKKAILGNLYTFSLTKLGDQLNALKSGDVISSARAVTEYMRDAKQRKDNNLNNLNLFDKVGITQQEKIFNTVDDKIGTIAGRKRIIPKVKSMSNLYEGNTIANNL